MRRGLTQPALHDALMERILERGNMQRAWKQVKANQGAPGIDGMRIEDFMELARTHWTDIRQAWLKSQGLISVRDLWMKAHGYT